MTEARLNNEEAMYAKFHRFEILGDILDAFLDSNDGGPYKLSELLAMPDNFKRYSKFVHCSIPYMATIKMMPFKKRQLQIKLPNNGFVYKCKEGDHIARHNSTKWLHLQSTFKYFPSLLNITPDHITASFFYNYEQQRVDFILKSQLDTIPDIMVTYEPGYPYCDDEDLYCERVR